MTFDDIGLILLEPRTGDELKKWLDVEGVFIRSSSDQAQIYRTLSRLMRGRLDCRTEQRSGPVSKGHLATAAGAERVATVLDHPYDPPARWKEADFGARMLFLQRLLTDSEAQGRAETDAWIRTLERQIEQWEPLLAGVDRSPIRAHDRGATST